MMSRKTYYQDHVEHVNARFERRYGRELRPGEIVRVLERLDRRWLKPDPLLRPDVVLAAVDQP